MSWIAFCCFSSNQFHRPPTTTDHKIDCQLLTNGASRMGIRIKQTLKKEGEMTLEERSRILDEIQATSLGVNVTPVPSSAGATHPIQMMSAMCLCIRSWVRHHHSLLDLKVFYTPSQTFLTYFFQMDDQGFKIRFQLLGSTRLIYSERIKTFIFHLRGCWR